MNSTNNLKSKIALSNTKAGTPPKNEKYKNAISCILKGKVYYNGYSGSGRFTSVTTNPPMLYLTLWGIDYKLGNDAPKGGRIGDYCELTAKGEKQVKAYREATLLEMKLEADKIADANNLQVATKENFKLAIKAEAAKIEIDAEFYSDILTASKFSGNEKSVKSAGALKRLLARKMVEKIDTDFWAVYRILKKCAELKFYANKSIKELEIPLS